MKSLRRFRLRGGGAGDDAEHDAPARNVGAAGPLSAPFDEAEAANRGELRFKHVLMNLGEGSQNRDGHNNARRNSASEAARQHSHNNHRGGSERARRAKSPLLDTVRVSVVAPPSKSAPPSSPSSPTSLRRRGRARRKWDGPSRDSHQGLQQLQVQRRGWSSTTADTSDASSPRQRADARGEKNLEVVPPSSLTRHLAAACDVMKEVNDGMMCHPNDVSGMTADTSFDDSRDGQREVATPRRHGGRPEDSNVIAPGNAAVNAPTGRLEKARAHPPIRHTGLPPEYDGDYDSALGWEAGQEVKLGGGGARREGVPRHDHDYRPLPPQRRSGKGMKPAKSQKKEQLKVQEEKQAKQKMQKEQQKAQTATGDRSQSVPKTRVRSPPPAVTPSPPVAKSRALPETKEQKRTEQKVQGKQRPKSATRQPPGQPPKQHPQPSQKQPPERPRPKSAPPRRPNTAVDAPASTTPSAAPTAKMANSSSKLLGRLLRRHRKPAMEPEEEGPGKARGKEEGDAEDPVRVSVIYNSARSGPAPPTVPTEPPKVRRIKEEPKEGAMARQSKPGGQLEGQPGGRRPDPPAAYRHMQSTVEQPTAKGKKTPPAAHRHRPSTVDPTAPSSTAQRPNPQRAPPQPKPRPAPPPPSKVKSHRRPRSDRHETPPDEWTTPLPFKKVHSTPSNFSSFFTRQSSRSSQFWEGVEEFPDPNRLFDNVIEEGGGENVEMTREGAAEYFRRHAVDVQKEKLGEGPRRGRTRRPRGSPRASPVPPPSEVSNAFSLQLPLPRDGAFDDSDISALRMHDSATVYFQQQQQGGREAGREADAPESEYWKRKYDLLREEMEGATEAAERHQRSTAAAEYEELQPVALDEMVNRRAEDRRTPLSTDARGPPTAGPAGASVQETHDEPTCDETLGSLGETHDGTLRTDDHSIGETYDETVGTDGDGTRTEWGRRCASPLDALHELWDGVVDLDRSEFDPPRCSDYHGGKKGRERAARLAAQCSAGAGLTQRELDRIAAAARGRLEGAAVQCASQLAEARKQRGPGGDAPRYRSVCAAANPAEEGLGSARLSEASPRAEREREREETGTLDTLETDDYDLRPAGYVPREGTPTGAPKGSPLAHATEGENDAALLSHYRERRAARPSPKALADDLTAGPSRLSLHNNDAADDDRSELSANARLIFEAALPRGAADGRGRPRSIVARSPSKLSSAAESNGATVPPDYARWFELPSPGTSCLPLLPLVDAKMRNALGVCDAEDVPSRVVADDAAALAFRDFCRAVPCAAEHMAGEGIEGTTGVGLGEGVRVGPLVAEGDGAVRFADGAATLPDISAAAVVALSRRRFEDAAEIYDTLRRACQASSGSKLGIVGRLLASTLHNLGVLHLWNQEYDRALPCCREALRVKAEGGGDDAGAVRLWANLGLANYALGSFASALAAFRKAGQMASQYLPDDGALAGRLANNQAVVNFEVGKLPLVQSQFRRSLQLQRGTSSSSPDVDSGEAAGEDLFSISITIFNVGAVCARQAQHASAASHLQACLAIQRALLGGDDPVVRSTAHYLDSARERAPAKSPVPGNRLGAKLNSEQSPPRAVMPAQPTAHARGSNPCSAPTEQGTSTADSQVTAPSGRRPISHSKGAQESSQSQRQQVASRILKGAQSGPAGPGQTSQPMLALGSLRAEATAAQRVQQSLEGCADSLALQGVGKGRNVSLLCQRPAPVPTKQTISQSVLNFGLQTMKKREGEAELQRHLERYGPRHPLVGESHRRLGMFHLHARNYPEAVAHLRSACRILGHALGENHPDVASAVRRLREKELGRRHPEMGRILNNLACVHYEMGDAARAEALLQEALDLQREVFTTAPAFLTGVSTVLCNIAFLHAKAGAFPKALIELEGALQIRQDILLEDNALDITKNMAHILAISQLQHGAVDLDEVTEEYVAMLRQSGTGR
ncbi:hypothetical protein ACHAXT_002830 [Thalassiosira profunda]